MLSRWQSRIKTDDNRPFLFFRIDADELKALLKKHNTTFTDEEIIELGELYYAGKSGGAVSIDNFIEAIDYAAANANGDDKNIRDK